jgi:hypothetical protein
VYDPPRSGNPDETSVWSVMRDTCSTCNPCSIPERAICGAAKPHMQRHARRAGSEIRRLPVVPNTTIRGIDSWSYKRLRRGPHGCPQETGGSLALGPTTLPLPIGPVLRLLSGVRVPHHHADRQRGPGARR